MLKFAQKTEKEEVWKQIIPETLLNEIKKREQKLAAISKTPNDLKDSDDDTSSISMGTVKNLGNLPQLDDKKSAMSGLDDALMQS